MKTKVLLIFNVILLCVVILMGLYIYNEKNEAGKETNVFYGCMENFMNPFFADISKNMEPQMLPQHSFCTFGIQLTLLQDDIQSSNAYYMYQKIYCDTVLMCLRLYDRKESEGNEKHVFYGCVENPIDPLFSDALIKAREQNEITYRMCQELYYNTWKAQYETIMQIIRKKCKYEEDIENYDLFEREIEEGFDRMKPLILNEMLDNYDMPESPEKHGYGNGTNGALLMYQGTVYRTACMFFQPMLDKEEYSFPKEEIQASIAEILGDIE